VLDAVALNVAFLETRERQLLAQLRQRLQTDF
jgi:hypothetical protein